MTRRAILVLLVLAGLACGKRGDPKPPVPVIPRATSDLVVEQRSDRLILSWSFPALTTTGRGLPSLQRISIFRYEEALPVSPGGPDPSALAAGDPTLPQSIVLFSKLPTLPKSQFVKLATLVESLDKTSLASATAGAKLIFSDAPPFVSSDGRPLRFTYAVVSEGDSATSEYSNLATIVPLPVAVAPTGLTAVAKAGGVILTWAVPQQAVGGGAAPVVSGYHVYRTVPGETPNEIALPTTSALLKDATFTDTPAYGEHEYRVAAVAMTGPPVLQSALSEPVRVTFRDLLPPPAPVSVTPLVETNAIRILWDAVEAADLAGYRIYRTEGAGHTNITEVGTIPLNYVPTMETTFLNTPVDLGIAFRYAVTAVDKSGNESARTWSPWIVAPKTP